MCIVLDPPVALAPKMVAQLPPTDLPDPGSDNQRPISYRDVLLGRPPNKRSPQEFSVPSLVVGEDDPEDESEWETEVEDKQATTSRIDRKKRESQERR